MRTTLHEPLQRSIALQALASQASSAALKTPAFPAKITRDLFTKGQHTHAF